MDVALGLVILFTLTYEPILGYINFQKFKRKVKTDDKERIKFYKNSINSLWVPTLFILSLVGFTDLSLEQIGLTSISLNTEILGKWVIYSAIIVGIIFGLAILIFIIGYRFNSKIKNSMDKMKKEESAKNQFDVMMPVTKQEKKLWTLVSLTAGITEEIIYRGLMIFALSYLLPGLSIWFILIFSSILFGLAHTYQGVKGVVRTTLIGLWFSIVYIGIGSIIPLILFHALVDYFGKIGEE
ncbi:CPBP family intramembrane glutamic endopeptidase [Neobacillus sp. PS2-9]|uniref:CPBP family intramembrane glutamic endopeptidase n=1 Tax=Neobacillus sp. PS2-9 TaxID=3070676 RepID=UPI0027E1B635|nr:CPBP family intramembrane glutamic endopeptidase [Neobacillus sp. PS2-9]WML55962.1 CPBP family intramembrane glutamic endopeptidase [Neobacillus sp. PS2-9]